MSWELFLQILILIFVVTVCLAFIGKEIAEAYALARDADPERKRYR